MIKSLLLAYLELGLDLAILQTKLILRNSCEVGVTEAVQFLNLVADCAQR